MTDVDRGGSGNPVIDKHTGFDTSDCGNTRTVCDRVGRQFSHIKVCCDLFPKTQKSAGQSPFVGYRGAAEMWSLPVTVGTAYKLDRVLATLSTLFVIVAGPQGA